MACVTFLSPPILRDGTTAPPPVGRLCDKSVTGVVVVDLARRSFDSGQRVGDGSRGSLPPFGRVRHHAETLE
jgi:hypothetical protein